MASKYLRGASMGNPCPIDQSDDNPRRDNRAKRITPNTPGNTPSRAPRKYSPSRAAP